MITARSAIYAYLAIILTVAALVFPKNARAASGNIQVCNPSSSCTVGEFLYDDSYSPIINATCEITIRNPVGTIFGSIENEEMDPAAENDGWYSYEFTASSTEGIYRTQVCCTPLGGDKLCLDKTFEVKTDSALSSGDVTNAVWDAPRSAHITSGSFGAALVSAVPSANDVASAVWGYSGRSLSTFGSLITDIWANTTRTLTGADLSSGSLAKKSDVDSVASNATNTTNNLLEQIINRPTIENEIEESSFTTTELQTKLEKSDSIANQLLTSGTYLKSKTNLLKAGGGDITRTVNQLETVVNSMDEQINWIAEQWDLPISSKLQAQNKKIFTAYKKLAASLKKVSSTLQLKSLSSDLDLFIKLVGSNTDSSKSNTLFGQLQAKKELSSALDKNYIVATTLLPNFGKDSKPSSDQIAQINILGAQVAAINQLPKMNKTILSQANAKMDQKQLKNKTLSLRGIVGANKQFLAQKPDQPLRSFWFEEGSIVFKTLISNPSKLISQKVPLKYYLPKEVTKENIIKTDEDLSVKYDTEKDQYYISGDFTLAPSETKTLTVTVDDSAFYINDQEIATMRKQAEELSKPLQNTAYFAQGVTLKTDIDASLDKVDSLQKTNTTPEARIRSYREAVIEFKAAKEKLEKLKEITTSAGSVGTLFGFVGGAQALAVWGLIIIMAAGFVFLALYMRAIRRGEKSPTLGEFPPLDDGFENYEEKPLLQNTTKKRFLIHRPIKYLTVILVAVLIGGGSIYALGTLRQGQVEQGSSSSKNVVAQATPQGVLGSSNENIASDSSRLDKNSYEQSSSSNKEVNILVPDESTVTVQSQPSINSLVLTSLKASNKAKEISRQDIWVKVSLIDSEGKNIEGWVDGDFIEEIGKKQSLDSDVKQKIAVISDTPTGFLRVRETPGGEEITKISPGEQYNLVKEAVGWVQIVLEDGTPGWVSKQYVSF